jgi:peptidoglycan/xylan/chitin deacetylase (PgdA/CDA1 family)
MAREANITKDHDFFTGTDYTIKFPVTQADGVTPEDVSSWALSWVLKKRKTDADADAKVSRVTGGGGIVISGEDNDVVEVLVSDSHTFDLPAGSYYHELKRTDEGSETVLAYGSVALQKSAHGDGGFPLDPVDIPPGGDHLRVIQRDYDAPGGLSYTDAPTIKGTNITDLRLDATDMVTAAYSRGDGTVAVAIFHDSYTAAQLENTLRTYLSVYTPVTYQQFSDWYTKGTPLPERPLLVTFDDGYALQYTDYKAVLEELSCPAVFFIVSGWIDGGTIADFQGKTPMSWAQVAALAASPLFSVQDHTFSHLDCLASSGVQVAADFAASIALFESNLGYTPSALAWPGGRYSATALDAVFRVGTSGNPAADTPIVYLPIHHANPRYELNRGGILLVGARGMYENVIPDPAWFPASAVWITATGASITTDAAGDRIVRHAGGASARTTATHKVPVALGQSYHLELKKLAVYGGAGVMAIQIILSDYDEAALETITVGAYTATDGAYIKINYDFRIKNPVAGWLQLAFYTDASSTGSRFDAKAMKLMRLPGLDSISGTRQLPKDA